MRLLLQFAGSGLLVCLEHSPGSPDPEEGDEGAGRCKQERKKSKQRGGGDLCKALRPESDTVDPTGLGPVGCLGFGVHQASSQGRVCKVTLQKAGPPSALCDAKVPLHLRLLPPARVAGQVASKSRGQAAGWHPCFILWLWAGF